MNKAEELIESIVQPLDEIKVLKSVKFRSPLGNNFVVSKRVIDDIGVITPENEIELSVEGYGASMDKDTALKISKALMDFSRR